MRSEFALPSYFLRWIHWSTVVLKVIWVFLSPRDIQYSHFCSPLLLLTLSWEVRMWFLPRGLPPGIRFDTECQEIFALSAAHHLYPRVCGTTICFHVAGFSSPWEPARLRGPRRFWSQITEAEFNMKVLLKDVISESHTEESTKKTLVIFISVSKMQFVE